MSRCQHLGLYFPSMLSQPPHHHSVPQRHLKVFCCCYFKFLIALDRFFSPIFSICFTSKTFSIPHVLWKRVPHLNYTVNSNFLFFFFSKLLFPSLFNPFSNGAKEDHPHFPPFYHSENNYTSIRD